MTAKVWLVTAGGKKMTVINPDGDSYDVMLEKMRGKFGDRLESLKEKNNGTD